MFQKTQKLKIQKKQIIFPLDYMNEHSMPNFGLLGGREAFPQMAIHFTKKLLLKYKGKYENRIVQILQNIVQEYYLYVSNITSDIWYGSFDTNQGHVCCKKDIHHKSLYIKKWPF